MPEFQFQIDRFIRNTNLNLNSVVRRIMLDVFTNVVMKTPVDTGRARGNWVVGINTPNRNVTNQNDPNGNNTIAQISNDLSRVDWRTTDKVFLTNTLPYIIRLEYGHSQQAPQGMVRNTLAEFQQILGGIRS